MKNKFRIGMVGGSVNSFMGDIHRRALEKTGQFELVCGAFGATRQNSFETGQQLGLPEKRVYGSYRDLFRRETQLPASERIHLVTIVTTNSMHYPVAMSAIDAGIPIFSEKPFTCNIGEALNLSRKQRDSGTPYGIAMNYAGYPMLRKARTLILDENRLGTIRKIVVNYTLGWLGQRLETAGNKQAGWRVDPRRNGPAGSVVDLGTHCFYVAEWLTGHKVTALCADTRPTVPGRILDDDSSILVRFENDVRGLFDISQIMLGRDEGLALEIVGDKGALRWRQHQPDQLVLFDENGTQTLEQGGTPFANASAAPAPFAGDDAYVDALAHSYNSFAQRLTQQDSAPAAPAYMTIEEGLRSVVFVDSVLRNITLPEAEEDKTPVLEKWTIYEVPPIPEL